MPPVSSTMQALNDVPLPLPLALLDELDGLLPQALRTSEAAATPASTAPVRLMCTDELPLDVGPGGRAGSGPGPDGPDPGPLMGWTVVDQDAERARRSARPSPASGRISDEATPCSPGHHLHARSAVHY